MTLGIDANAVDQMHRAWLNDSVQRELDALAQQGERWWNVFSRAPRVMICCWRSHCRFELCCCFAFWSLQITGHSPDASGNEQDHLPTSRACPQLGDRQSCLRGARSAQLAEHRLRARLPRILLRHSESRGAVPTGPWVCRDLCWLAAFEGKRSKFRDVFKGLSEGPRRPGNISAETIG